MKCNLKILVVLVLTPICHIWSQEVCDDGVDNDLDGFVDYYDDDCDCDDQLFNAQCENKCEVPPELGPLEMSLKWISPPVGGRESPNIIVSPLTGLAYGTNGLAVQLSTGAIVSNWPSGITNASVAGNTLLFSIDGTAAGHRFVRGLGSRFTCRDEEGNLVWVSDSFGGGFGTSYYPKAADINQDGIPEVYVSNIVLNGDTGDILYNGTGSDGCNFTSEFNDCFAGAHTVAADFTDHPGLELAVGDQLIELQINNITGEVGNSFNIIDAPPEVNNGFTSMGDINADGQLDIIVSRGNSKGDGGIWVWDPMTQSLIATGESGVSGGVPVVVDVNADCYPEIIVAYDDELRVLSYNGTPQLEVLYTIETVEDSGFNSATVFDLNGNGRLELIYKDEEELRIFVARSGQELASYPINSVTTAESPVVTDTDNDGHAEILVNGYLNDKDTLQLFCFESGNRPWAPARRVWNQTGYHVTNVNDDLTIPQYQQSLVVPYDTDDCLFRTCPQVYNTFGVQATYRTQEGCITVPSQPDLRLTVLDYSCQGDSTVYCLAIENISATDITPDCLSVAWYLDSLLVNNLRDTFRFCPERDANTARFIADTVKITIPSFINGFYNIYWTVNDVGMLPGIWNEPITDLPECDYSNNIDTVTLTTTLACRLDFTYVLGDSCSYYLTVDSIIAGEGCLDLYTMSILFDSAGVWVPIETSTLTEPGTYQIEVQEPISSNSCFGLLTLESELVPVEADLGPDILRCDDQEIVLTVPSGDDAYLWSDGSTDTSTVAVTDGEYWVLVTSHCGEQVMDTIQITTFDGDPIELIAIDPQCPGATVSVETTVVADSLRWQLDGTDTCQNCAALLVVVDTLNLVTVTAWQSGCLWTDTLSLMPIVSVYDTVYITACAEDTVTIYDLTITTSGYYEHTTANCDSIITIDISYLPKRDSVVYDTLCIGDSLSLHGEVFFESGSYDILLFSSTGCDSILTVELALLEPVRDTVRIDACFGDTLLVLQESFVEDTLLTTTMAGPICDTLLLYDMYFMKPDTFMQQKLVCYGDSLLLGDISIANDTSIQILVADSSNNCGVVVWTEVNVLDQLPDVEFQPSITVVSGSDVDVLLDESELWQVGIVLSSRRAGLGDLGTGSQLAMSNVTTTDTINVQYIAGNCDYWYEFVIRVVDENDIPNIFSPNGDNINDFWYYDFVEYGQVEVAVYDRWGNKVVDWSGSGLLEWDGTAYGKHVATGVYVMIIRQKVEDGDSALLVLDVTIVR